MKRNSMRAICLVLTLFLLAASAVPALAAKKDRAKGAYRVVVDEPRKRLNVHETPESGTDNVIARLNEGTVLMYQECVDGWWFIKWWKGHDDFREGYVDKSFLVPVDKDPSIVYTCVDNTYLHSTSDITEGDCAMYHIGKVMAGTRFSVLEQYNTWSRISYNDTTGWIPSKYLVQAK